MAYGKSFANGGVSFAARGEGGGACESESPAPLHGGSGASTDVSIDAHAVRNAAGLARIGLSDEEIPELQNDMKAIVQWFAALQNVDTSGVQPISHPHENNSGGRDDEPESTSHRDDVLTNAPRVIEGFYAVPKVIE